MRHEGTFFTKNFQWELADARDFHSMALSGAGAAQSTAGLASGINEAAKAYRQWKEINILKKLGEGGLGTNDINYLYRKTFNTGNFKYLDELMQLKNVKR